MTVHRIINGIGLVPIIILGVVASLALRYRDWRRQRTIKTVYNGDEKAYLYDKWRGMP